jgi:type IV fimbrial biogenesis protein FimT
MFTLSVAAVLVTVGVPSMVTMMQNSRATTHTNELVTAFNLARSEATKRGAAVTICSTIDGATCGNAVDWSTGWVVLAPNGTLIRSWPERSGGAGIMIGNVDQVQFQPRGSIAAAGSLFRVRIPDCTGNQGRDVTINVAGRVSVNRVAC